MASALPLPLSWHFWAASFYTVFSTGFTQGT
jgi:hypothetical protein